MKISGLQKTSLLDYPNKIAAIVFTQGCPFRCGFCYNPELLDATKPGTLTEEEIFNFFKKRQGVLEAVVITGGEPTMQADLPEFARKIRALGLLVKLDTNGTNPILLKKMLEENLLDYIAMDIKAPLENYDRVTQVKVDLEAIRNSVGLIMGSGVDYEFRSTILPALHTAKDVIKMAEIIKGAKKYYLQKFTGKIKLQKPELQAEAPFDNQKMEELCLACLKFVEKCEVR